MAPTDVVRFVVPSLPFLSPWRPLYASRDVRLPDKPRSRELPLARPLEAPSTDGAKMRFTAPLSEREQVTWQDTWRATNANALIVKAITTPNTAIATTDAATLAIATATATTSDAMDGGIMWTEMCNASLFPLAAMACFSTGCAAVDASANL